MENKVFILDQTTIKKLLTIYKLVIPDFQRNFVWKKSKKRQLLESLFRGFPIGAITLFDNKNAYYVIDGLQRINTLNQYLSHPESIISFEDFYEKVEENINGFLESKRLDFLKESLKKCIRKWYERLNHLYEYEKVSVLYAVLKEGNQKVSKEFETLETVEKLLEILKKKIEISHDDIALIIYKGSKEDLPELFKNINTGSMALSQYEILQSVWNGYVLDRHIVEDTWEAFERELELAGNEYEINAVKEVGTFDIFKNIMGINHMICCKEDADIIFHFSGFKQLPKPLDCGGEIVKYYSNDSIAFEIFSAVLCHSPNRIVQAIDIVYGSNDSGKISKFINKINQIILEAVDAAIKELKAIKPDKFGSKYHSLYILCGMIFSRYDIDTRGLTVKESEKNAKIYSTCLDIERHVREKWFEDGNRQVSFLNIKIEELLDMKRSGNENTEGREGLLELRIGDEIIVADTVKNFYRKIFELLYKQQIDISSKIPYATGRKRYLVNWKNQHINGDPFISPIQFENIYIETHKSKSGAVRDIYNFLKNMGLEVSYMN